jgi:hypothetical protein
MSALPPKADIGTQSWHVRFVPKADILRCGKERRYSITCEAERLGGCEVDDEIKFVRLQHW